MTEPEGLNPFRIGKAALDRAHAVQAARRKERKPRVETAECIDCHAEFSRLRGSKHPNQRCRECYKEWKKEYNRAYNVAHKRGTTARASGVKKPCRLCPREFYGTPDIDVCPACALASIPQYAQAHS